MSSKTEIKVLHLSLGKGSYEQVKSDEQVARLSKLKNIAGLPAEQVKKLWSDVCAGKETDLSELDAPVQKKIKAAITALEAVKKNHESEAKRIEELANIEKAKDEQKAKEWTLQVAKSDTIATEVSKEIVGGAVAAIQTGIGDKFVVGTMGLKPSGKGDPLTETDVVGVFRALYTMYDGGRKVDAMLNFQLGDAAQLAYQFGSEEGDAIIAHAMEVQGQKKHTALEARRCCEFLDPEKGHRREGLPYTHHQKILNYKGLLEKLAGFEKDPAGKFFLPYAKQSAKAQAALDQAITDILDFAEDNGSPTRTIKSVGGKPQEIMVKNHRTVREIAEFIQKMDPEYKPKEPTTPAQPAQSTETKEGGEKAPAEPAKSLAPKFEFIYMDYTSGQFYGSNQLSLKACADRDTPTGEFRFAIVNSITGIEYNGLGEELKGVDELPGEFRYDVPAEAEVAP